MRVNGKTYTFRELIQFIVWEENIGWAELERRSGVDQNNLKNYMYGLPNGRLNYGSFNRIYQSVGYSPDKLREVCEKYDPVYRRISEDLERTKTNEII